VRAALRRGLLACAATLTFALLAGCGGGTYRSTVRPPSEAPPAQITADRGAADGGAVNPPRPSGNPPFYDVLASATPLRARDGRWLRPGIASWYGLTSTACRFERRDLRLHAPRPPTRRCRSPAGSRSRTRRTVRPGSGRSTTAPARGQPAHRPVVRRAKSSI
jgi:hypothetical protein